MASQDDDSLSFGFNDRLRAADPCSACSCRRDYHSGYEGPCFGGCSPGCRAWGGPLVDGRQGPSPERMATEIWNRGRMATEAADRERRRQSRSAAEAIQVMRKARERVSAKPVVDEDYLAAWKRQATKDGELETEEPSLHLTLSKGAKRCPFCMDDDFENSPSIRCSACEAWVHVECWAENKNKCAACGEKRNSG